ncbi:CREB3 regulatory factor isoform X2 [Syngnathoides biaculeatus]|uniref:CREB3 regulatory factor isoform X2 n=1 Tax=Syngnathoides biaculeatus TaxID=300417 RepID=UPI002ADDA3E7|nr:CREB3 regulatory factor isoform X2 [Syngnathoides biaculeatus]
MKAGFCALPIDDIRQLAVGASSLLRAGGTLRGRPRRRCAPLPAPCARVPPHRWDRTPGPEVPHPWSAKLCLAMPQPSANGMEPPFGDDFQHFFFADQALTSTELLANTLDPDFMYELDRDTSHRQSPYGDGVAGVADGAKDCEAGPEQQLMMAPGECDAAQAGSAFEEWDGYWEDLTRYTRLTSCDIWGTKEVDFLGLDDFSSPYQDEEVISRTPTLAQLNGEDSQPVCEALYPPAEPTPPGPQPPPAPAERMPLPGWGAGLTRPSASCASSSRLSRSLLPDFPEGFQKATRPVPSSTETMTKTQEHRRHVRDREPSGKAPARASETSAPSTNFDFVRKAKVRLSSQRAQLHAPSRIRFEKADVPPALRLDVVASAGNGEPAPATGCGFSAGKPTAAAPLQEEVRGAPEGEAPGPKSAGGLGEEEKSKEEEHNYSLFLTRSRQAARSLSRLDDDDEEEDEEEDEEDDEGDGQELDDDDHNEDCDEGFGTEHDLSDNEEEEEEEDEDEDYEADKDGDMSDILSEPGGDGSLPEDAKGSAAGASSRKRGKHRYFWEYSEQLTPSKQERLLKPSEWDRQTLPSNLYQKNKPLHGKYTLKKSRRTDVEDLTPNPRKLLQIGIELRKLNKVIGDLTPVSELPFIARPGSRKEKNKLASRACRLKKKAQYEANKVKLWGLSTEYDRLLFVINAIKGEIVTRAEDPNPGAGSMSDTLDRIIRDKLVSADLSSEITSDTRPLE